MVAFYACLYYAALRPEEAVGIIVPRNLLLPDEDDEWGKSRAPWPTVRRGAEPR
jgi:hypothetical protein